MSPRYRVLNVRIRQKAPPWGATGWGAGGQGAPPEALPQKALAALRPANRPSRNEAKMKNDTVRQRKNKKRAASQHSHGERPMPILHTERKWQSWSILGGTGTQTDVWVDTRDYLLPMDLSSRMVSQTQHVSHPQRQNASVCKCGDARTI